MTTPTTPAGRALLRWAEAMDKRLDADIGLGDYHGTAQVIDESVAAIEAEARADLLDRLAAGVRAVEPTVPWWHTDNGDPGEPGGYWIDRATVLALIEEARK